MENIIQLIKDWMFEVEDRYVPLERQLAANRHVKGKTVKEMAANATSVGAMANDMAQDLGEEKAVRATLLEKAKARRKQLASAEAAATDPELIELANEIAESDAEIKEIEQMVKDSFRDKADAIRMVLDQSKIVEKLERKDASMVRRGEMITLRETQQAMKENMLQVFPEDTSDLRDRHEKSLSKRENRLAARVDVIDALWAEKSKRAPVEPTVDAQSIMAEIEKGA
jgi:hypothetical protein